MSLAWGAMVALVFVSAGRPIAGLFGGLAVGNIIAGITAYLWIQRATVVPAAGVNPAMPVAAAAAPIASDRVTR